MRNKLPPRKHGCELCFYIFVCHLCGINDTHPLHINNPKIKEKIYICQFCAHETDLVYCLTVTDAVKIRIVRIYDYMSGKLVHAFNTFPGRKKELPRWFKSIDDIAKVAMREGWIRDF